MLAEKKEFIFRTSVENPIGVRTEQLHPVDNIFFHTGKRVSTGIKVLLLKKIKDKNVPFGVL